MAKTAILETAAALEPDPAGYTAMFSVLDRSMHAQLGRWTFGLSPRAAISAYLDWVSGVAFSPGKQAQLLHKAQRKWLRLAMHMQQRLMGENGAESCIEPLPQDTRFSDPAWRRLPFNFLYQAFLLNQQWWHNATTGVSGVTPQSEQAVEFAARQWLDMVSPSNFLLTNPVVIETTLREGGRNLLRGLQHWNEDVQALIAGKAPAHAEAFELGRDIAATPGKVVYRNRLIELIQYAPATDAVYAEPVLITPAWIMKYYVLDLAPTHSLVKTLVEAGHTVFMISWKNPDADDRELGLEDYRRLGPLAALDAIGKIAPERPVHGVGYCLGGTLMAIAAAAMARDGDRRLKTLTLLATQTDFEEAGELMLFTNEKQVAFLKDLMWEQGFLDARQMAGAFQLLRSNDLIWSRLVRDYLLGERAPTTDLMAWNADGTRLPYRMHSEYLDRLFLRNDLSEGRYQVDEAPIDLADIAAPIFAVATETDHVAPWRSVHKLHQLTHSDLTFVLCNGGHNAGIVSDPTESWRSFRANVRKRGERTLSPDQWLERAEARQGSWWPFWLAWLSERSGQSEPPPAMGAPDAGLPALAEAPGGYVRMR